MASATPAADSGVSPNFMACRGLFVEGAPPESMPSYAEDEIITLCKFDNINGSPHAFPVLAIAYDPAARLAQWVAYRSDAWMAAKTDDPFLEQLGRKEFNPDADLRLQEPPIAQQDLDEGYGRESGFDRGHLKPSELAQWSAGAWAQTYLTSNIVPQARDLNQGPWSQMEQHWLTWTAAQGGTVLDRPVALEDETFLVNGFGVHWSPSPPTRAVLTCGARSRGDALMRRPGLTPIWRRVRFWWLHQDPRTTSPSGLCVVSRPAVTPRWPHPERSGRQPGSTPRPWARPDTPAVRRTAPRPGRKASDPCQCPRRGPSW